MPFHPRAEREADQGPLQFRAAFDEAGKRLLVAACLMARGATSLPQPRQARDGLGPRQPAAPSAQRVKPLPGAATSYRDLTVLRSAPTQDSLRADVSRSAVFTLGEEPALRRRRPDVSFIRRLPV